LTKGKIDSCNKKKHLSITWTKACNLAFEAIEQELTKEKNLHILWPQIIL
jgi:hypothetical protein